MPSMTSNTMLGRCPSNQSGNRDSNPESPAPKAGMLAVTPFPVKTAPSQQEL